MKVSSISLCALLCLWGASVHANTNNIVIDLADQGTKTVYVANSVDSVSVQLINLPPKLRNYYSINTDYQRVTIDLFQPVSPGAGVANDNCLLAIAAERAKLNQINDPNNIPTTLANIEQALIANPDCNNTHMTQINSLRQSTIYTTNNIQLMKDYLLTIEVVENGNTIASRLVKRPEDDKEWLTHVGFSFVKNRGQSWYSKGVTETVDGADSTSYIVAKQNNNPEYIYTPSILFTYPMVKGESVDWGYTAGLSSDSESIAVLLGGSAIIKKNFILSFGVVFQEFEELNGTYHEGMVLQDGAVDSTSLTSSSFKSSFAITFGFRFGDN